MKNLARAAALLIFISQSTRESLLVSNHYRRPYLSGRWREDSHHAQTGADNERREDSHHAQTGADNERRSNDMNKKFILALMLASGMAFAQGGSGSSPDQSSQPSQQP